jgi:hypothetical protein
MILNLLLLAGIAQASGTFEKTETYHRSGWDAVLLCGGTPHEVEKEIRGEMEANLRSLAGFQCEGKRARELEPFGYSSKCSRPPHRFEAALTGRFRCE